MIEPNTDNFPLLIIDTPPIWIDDSNIFVDTFEKVFEIARERKQKVSVMIKCEKLEGIGLMASGKMVKYLLNNRDRIIKYFMRSVLLMINDDNIVTTILNMYTPARPLKVFAVENETEAIRWLCGEGNDN